MSRRIISVQSNWAFLKVKTFSFHSPLLWLLHKHFWSQCVSLQYTFPSPCFFILSIILCVAYISCRDCGELRLICGSCCVVSPTGYVCVMASIWALSKQMRIRRARLSVWTVCRRAPAGKAKPQFNPCSFFLFWLSLLLMQNNFVL